MNPEERLSFHRQHSLPLMEGLDTWCRQQLEDSKVEPNSGLGKAIQYLLNHWQKLTLFLRVPGPPLDNNLCERALKKVILLRKNALFYRTTTGARVGDLFMSLIHTAELCGVNPFDLPDGVAAEWKRSGKKRRPAGCPGTTGTTYLKRRASLPEASGYAFLPIDRPIDVISIASLIFLVTSRLADQRTKAHAGTAGPHRETLARPTLLYSSRSRKYRGHGGKAPARAERAAPE